MTNNIKSIFLSLLFASTFLTSCNGQNQMPQQQPNPNPMLQNQMHQSSRQLQASSQNLPPANIQNYQIDSGQQQQQYAASSSTNSTPATSSTHQLAQTTDWEDTELNDILEKVIDFVPDCNYSDGDISSLLSFSTIDSSTPATPTQSKKQEEIAKTGINSLKVHYNKVFGY